ncbi:MAG: DUF1573 domain-containing protein [Phycisphaerales bacterium]
MNRAIAFVETLLVVASLVGCKRGAERLPDHVEVHDAGHVVYDTHAVAVTHTFTVRNPTDRALTILDIVKSCGCVNVTPSSNRIPAGGGMSLQLNFDISHPGAHRESASVHLSDGSKQRFIVTASAMPEAMTRFIPRRVAMVSGDVQVQGDLLLDFVNLEQTPPVFWVQDGGLGGERHALHISWTLIDPGSLIRKRPARWLGPIEARVRNSSANISFGSEEVVHISWRIPENLRNRQ